MLYLTVVMIYPMVIMTTAPYEEEGINSLCEGKKQTDRIQGMMADLDELSIR